MVYPLSTPNLRDRLEDALRGQDADYLEIRIEERRSCQLIYRGRELEEISITSSCGGSIRALVSGGWGFVSFNDLDGLREKVALAISHARWVGREESRLASVEPVEYIEAEPPPPDLPLETRKELLDEYNDLIWGTPKIQTSFINYGDAWRRVIFASSEGSFIEQRRWDISLRVRIVARDGGEVQQAGISEGSLNDFGKIRNLHDRIKEAAGLAVKMLNAPQVRGGEYTVVLDPVLGGVFAHEAFGHLSEADFLYENPRLKEIMTLGRRFGGKHLNIVDGAAVPGLRGSYKYDDEGVPAAKTYLIREGILVGRLHSRETAAKMGEKPTGNARAISFRYPPIVRMTNTYIESGEATFDDLLSEIKEGLYVRNWYGGQTSMEMFTFSAGEAFMIRNGKIAELLRPVVLSGNVFTTLENIDAIANDLTMNEGGGCGKGGQVPLPVSNGSPHIRIRRCLVGGR